LAASGSYFDIFYYDALHASFLNALGPGGSRRYRCAGFDCRTGSVFFEPGSDAPVDAVLVFDGTFCQRPELVDSRELRRFRDVGFRETLRRMQMRDQAATSSAEGMKRRHLTRYVPGLRLYLAAARSREHAHLDIDNTDSTQPRLIGGN
jgi:uridine kinase